MYVAAQIDEFGKPAWIALTVLAFFFWWPFGLAMLAFLIGSGRMGCGKHGRHGSWGSRGWGEQMSQTADRWFGGGGRRPAGNSGNWAFEEYRSETLKRLEDEEQEFKDFLQRLRRARDKQEFDDFLNERRRRDATPPQA